MIQIRRLKKNYSQQQNHDEMAFIDECRSFAESCSTSADLPELHAGQHDLDNGNRNRNHRNYCHRTDGWGLHKLFRLQHHSKWSSWRGWNHVFSNDGWRGVSIRDCGENSRGHRNRGHQQSNRTNLYQKLAVGILPVIFFLPSNLKVNAQESTATANPIATSSGSVSNQAVQINQGGYSEQGFAQGHYCNSSTLTFTPFYLGNDVHPEYVRNQNFGIQMTFSFPLDGGMVELCKSLAKKRLQKERLDYSLIRALKCAELLEKGFMFRPESPYSVVCDDVVPIALEPKSTLQTSSSAGEQ